MVKIMNKKIFYVTSEMEPFASASNLSQNSNSLPLYLQDSSYDVRCLMPKYGFISERKYILREVIRLKEILFNLDSVSYSCSAKSAFLPKNISSTRLQVYFLENEDLFGELNNLLYKSKNGRYLLDNESRYFFYSLASIKMLPNLFWYPDVIICNGWTSAFIPFLLNHLKNEDSNLSKIKTIYLANSNDNEIVLNSSVLNHNDSIKSKLNTDSYNEVGSSTADMTIIIDHEIKVSKDLMKKKGFKGNKNCHILDSKDENFLKNFSDLIKSVK